MSGPTSPEHAVLDGDGFRLRGTEMSRVDGFSDVVFGFALTLLVVSLEVPKGYAELHELVRGFLPFAVNFTMLMTVWYAHYHFFRRFGLHDTWTIVLNAALLFVVLFYVYPLKFLFGLVVGQALGLVPPNQLTAPQAVELMTIYGLGFMVIYLLFAALHWNGWRQRELLGLNTLERSLTRISIFDHLATAGIGLLSCLLAITLPAQAAGYAGLSYLLLGVTKTVFGFRAGRAVRVAGMKPS